MVVVFAPAPRIIPALAGNTCPTRGHQANSGDHPRSRGEYGTPLVWRQVASGSSPLSRGIPLNFNTYGQEDRIIPALAGNTRIERGLFCITTDHPRSRGEYCGLSLLGYQKDGSSPLSRGIQQARNSYSGVLRIIPALAGNTTSMPTPMMTSTDHPRSRGEYRGRRGRYSRAFGSSPLSRGIHRHSHVQGQPGRIIPALAGNTSLDPPAKNFGGDHPRSRGEYATNLDTFKIAHGSSPLSRGIPPGGPAVDDTRGIIPALAGNTPSQVKTYPSCPDHPRSRGEYGRTVLSFNGGSGSSPLSRGILSASAPTSFWRRIIPALAGNTRDDDQHDCHRRDHPRSRGEYIMRRLK